MEGENSNNSFTLFLDPEAPAKETEQPVNDGKTEATGMEAKPSGQPSPSAGQPSPSAGQSSPSKGQGKGTLLKNTNIMRNMMAMAEQKDEEREWQKFSAAEMKVLVREVELRKEALFGDYKEGESPKYRWLIWQEVAEKVNEVNPAVHRNLEQVRIKWFDYKDPSNKWEKRIKKSNPGYKHSTGMFFKRRPASNEGGADSVSGEGGAEEGESEDRVRKLPASQANVPESVRLKSILSKLNDDKASKAIKYLSHSTQRQGIALMAMKSEPKERKDVENGADGGTTGEGEGDKGDRFSADGPKKTYSKGLKSDSSLKKALKWMLGTDGEVLKPKEMKEQMLGKVQKMEPKSLSEVVNLLAKISAKPGEGAERITLKTSESLSTESKSGGVKRPGEEGVVPEPKRVMFGGTNEELKALLKSIDPSKVKVVKMKHPETGKEMLVTKILAPEALRALAKQKKVAIRPIAPKATGEVVQATGGEASAGVTNGGNDDKSGESVAGEGKGLSLPQLVTEEEGTEKATVGDVQGQQKLMKNAVSSKTTPLQLGEPTEVEAATLKSESKGVIDRQISSIEEGDGNAVDFDMQPDQDDSMTDIHNYDGESSNDPAKLLLAIGDVTNGLVSTPTNQSFKIKTENANGADSSETLLSNSKSNPNMVMQIGEETEAKSQESPGKEVSVPRLSSVRTEQDSSSGQMTQSANDLAQKILKAVRGSPGKSAAGKKMTPIQPGDVRLLKVGGKTVKVLIVNNDDHNKGTKTTGTAPLQGPPVDDKASVVGQVAAQGVAVSGAAPSVAPTSTARTIKTNLLQPLLPKPSVLQTVVTTLPTKVVSQAVPITPSNIAVSPNVIPVAGNNILSVASPVMAPNMIPIVASNLVTIAQPMSVVTAPAPISTSKQKPSTDVPIIMESADGVPVKPAGNVTTVDANAANVLTTSTPRQAGVKTSLSKQLLGIKGLSPISSSQATGAVGTAIGNILTSLPKVKLVSLPQKILPKGAIVGGRKPNILSSPTKTGSATAASAPSFGVKRVAPTVVKAGMSKLKVRVVTGEGDGKELEKKQHPLVKAALSGKPIDFQEELKKLDPEDRTGGTAEGSKGQGTLSGGISAVTTGHTKGKDEDVQVITLSPSPSGIGQRQRMVVPSTVSQLRVKSAESLQSIRIASPGTLNKKISLSHIAVLNSSTQGQRQSPVKGKRKQELTVKTLDSVGAKRLVKGGVVKETIDADDCVILEEIGTRMPNPPEVFCVDSNDSYGVEVS